MISIIGYPEVKQMQAFEPVRDCLNGGLEVDMCLGAFMASPLGIDLSGKVIYNMEYLHDHNPTLGYGYLETLERSVVVDFSKKNIEWLASKGIEAIYMPYGFDTQNIKPQLNVEKDIDVLFIGSMHFDRRINVVSKLQRMGLNIVVAKDTYGAALDRLISRSKVHLNMHHAEGQPLETVRVNQLLSMGCSVVSERGSDDALNDLYDDLLVFTGYEELHSKCFEVVANGYSIGSIPEELIQDCSQVNNLGAGQCQQ